MNNLKRMVIVVLSLGFISFANAAIVPAGMDDFSGSEVIIDFSLPAIDEAPITNQYQSLGVTFSGSIYTMQNPSDTIYFPNNGDGQIASNWLYNGVGHTGDTIIINFSTLFTTIGFDRSMWPTDTLTIEAFNASSSLGSISLAGATDVVDVTDFVAIRDNSGIDQLILTVSGSNNHFIAIDNLRFEGAPSAVPVPGAVWLFGSGLLCLAGFTKRITLS